MYYLSIQIKKLNIDKIQNLNISDTIKIIQILSDMVCLKICSKLSCKCISCEDPCAIAVTEKECNELKVVKSCSCTCFDDLDNLIDEHLSELKVK